MSAPYTYLVAFGITVLYGVVSLAGGIMGYVRASSVPSLIAGGIAGVLLILCALGIWFRPIVSLSGAIIIAVALLGRFLPKLIREWSDLDKSIGSRVALVMSVGGILVIALCALTLATKSFPSSKP
jgi:uncharacterized membrane protein (UPF0136 family)